MLRSSLSNTNPAQNQKNNERSALLLDTELFIRTAKVRAKETFLSEILFHNKKPTGFKASLRSTKNTTLLDFSAYLTLGIKKRVFTFARLKKETKSSSVRCPMHHWTHMTSYLWAGGVNSYDHINIHPKECEGESKTEEAEETPQEWQYLKRYTEKVSCFVRFWANRCQILTCSIKKLRYRLKKMNLRSKKKHNYTKWN